MDLAFTCFHKYNVASPYNYLLSSVNISVTAQTNKIWNKEVRQKVSLFAWHLLHNCLPNTNNLFRRHVLQPNVQFCLGGCGMM